MVISQINMHGYEYHRLTCMAMNITGSLDGYVSGSPACHRLLAWLIGNWFTGSLVHGLTYIAA